MRFLFQFPSNGKARVNWQGTTILGELKRKVSIPFKRESTCEQTTKEKLRRSSIMRLAWFQFPSNGKARVNFNPRGCKWIRSKSFNSLQTGKHV